MALFDNQSSIYQDSYVLKQRMEHDYRNYSSANQMFQTEANLDLQYYAGDQNVWNQYFGPQAYQGQRQFVFNLIKRTIEMPGGYQRQHRKSSTVIPIENGDQVTADQLSKVMSWIERTSGMLDIISDAFTYGTLITGMNLVELWVDYTNDPISGDIKYDRIAHNAFIIDPYFKKIDLSDCNSIWKRSFVTKTQAQALLPDYRKEIQTMSGSEARDGKFQFLPENYNFDLAELLTYDEYYYLDTRKQKLIVDKDTGDTKEWDGEDDILRYVLQNDPRLTVVDNMVQTVNQGIVLQGQVMYDGGNLLGIDKYPFVPWLGYYSPDLANYQWRIQGMVRGLRDPQFLYNRRQVISLDVLESVATSGYIATEGSVIDPESLYKTGQGQVIWRKKGSSPEDINRIPPSDISPGMAKMAEDMSSLIREISGVNEELLGMSQDDIPGILSMMRQGSGLITLQRLFNNSDSAQKQLAKLTCEVVQKNFTPGKIKRIIEEEPTAEFYNQNFGKYDMAIEEGFNTTTQKQQQLAQMLQLQEAGVVQFSPEEMLEAATIQNKTKIIERIKAEQMAQQQIAQQQQAMQMQEQQATIQMAQARAAADTGLAIERESRVNENENLAVERHFEAQKDHEDAMLARAKTLKELQEIDLNQIEKIYAMARQIQYDQMMERQQFSPESIELQNKLLRLGENMPSVEPPAQALQ